MDIKNLTIIGTSHISKDSVSLIKQKICKEKPDIVCVELDRNRLKSLMSNEPKSKVTFSLARKVGVKGYIFAKIAGMLQSKLGGSIGSLPGEDMKSAVIEAKKADSKIYLIDQDIMITLKRISESWKIKDTFNLVKELMFGFFSKKKVPFNISKVPTEEVIEILINDLSKKFPFLYKAVIEERNVVMSRRIAKLLKENPDKKIIAVLGAGHKKEMVNMLKYKFE